MSESELSPPELLTITNDSSRYSECKDWPSRKRAADQFGVSQRSLERWWEQGHVEKVIVDGVQRFSPDDISLRIHGDASDAAAVTTAAGDFVNEQTTALSQARRHIEALFGKFEKTYDLLLKTQMSLNEQLINRCNQLEKSHADAIEAREAALSEAAERNMLERQQLQSDRRKDVLLQFLVQQLGPRIAMGLGGGGVEAKVVQSFDKEQLETLIEAGVLEDEQTQLIKQYIATRWPEPKPETETEATNTERKET